MDNIFSYQIVFSKQVFRMNFSIDMFLVIVLCSMKKNGTNKGKCHFENVL